MAPQTMKAIVTLGDGQIHLKENVAVPKPGPGEILVKVVAAAQNPTDWKTVVILRAKGAIVGCDFAGIVEEIGPDVPEGVREIGERVASFVHGGIGPNGSFAEYLVADARLIIHIPDEWSFEHAAQLGVASYTACMCLYRNLSLPTPPTLVSEPTDLLIWSGTSSVGQYAIQFACLSGLRVISTASETNMDLVRSLGAAEVYDYKNPETPHDIKESTSGKLRLALDCISAGKTPGQVSETLSDEGGVVSIMLPYHSKAVRGNIRTIYSLTYTLLGKAFRFPEKLDPIPENYDFGVKMSVMISDLLAKGKLKPSPVKVFPNGLADVREGFRLAREGRTGGAKVTYMIADTP